MDRLRDFLNTVKAHQVARDNFLGLLHVLIGRRITLADNTLVSGGMTWRELASVFKRVRWEREAVRELGLDPADLPPRDRQRFWYMAIAQARVDNPSASAAGDRLADSLRSLGYEVGLAPRPSP